MDEIYDARSDKQMNDFRPANVPNSTAVLVLGIISIVGCIFYGVPGLICGIISLVLYRKDKALYDTDPVRYEPSFKNSRAGFICAIIGTSLSALVVLWFMIVLFVIGTAVSASPFSRF